MGAALRHRDVSTTMHHLRVLETGTGVRSPLDQLAHVTAERVDRPLSAAIASAGREDARLWRPATVSVVTGATCAANALGETVGDAS